MLTAIQLAHIEEQKLRKSNVILGTETVRARKMFICTKYYNLISVTVRFRFLLWFKCFASPFLYH